MNQIQYQAEERRMVMGMMMMVGGMMGAYTYVLRGGVFCNAQTGNVLLMGIALGEGQWAKGLYYLIPFAAYLAGSFVSERFRSSERKWGSLKWTTSFTGLELLTLFLMGWIPLQMPDQIVQVGINFLASIQYNSFRSAEGVPMSTTFCTNHVRQMGIWLADWRNTQSKASLQRVLLHLSMLGCFLTGTAVITALAPVLKEHVIWIADLPLLLVFGVLLLEDFCQNENSRVCMVLRQSHWMQRWRGCPTADADRTISSVPHP